MQNKSTAKLRLPNRGRKKTKSSRPKQLFRLRLWQESLLFQADPNLSVEPLPRFAVTLP
jgi:hypothetical protein